MKAIDNGCTRKQNKKLNDDVFASPKVIESLAFMNG